MQVSDGKQHAVAALDIGLSEGQRAAALAGIEAVVGAGNVGPLAPDARNPVGRSMFWVVVDHPGQAQEIARLRGVRSCNIQPERHAL